MDAPANIPGIELRIGIAGTDPLIWRQLKLPAIATVADFHSAVQRPEVRLLREQAQEWKLARKYKGRLLLTPVGRTMAGDSAALWDFAAERCLLPGTTWKTSPRE